MGLDFQQGTPDNPAGHAILYFTDHGNESSVYATYLIVPPIKIELAKYMPPLFASKVSLSDMENVSSIPLPPVPEQVENLGYLSALAESRGDDLVYGGVVDASDVERMLYSTSEAARTYLEMYNRRPSIPELAALREGEEGSSDVGEVLFPLMSDKDKLGELSKLTGSLRYAIEGNDHVMAGEIRHQMKVLGKHLGENFKISELIEAAQTPGLVASKLSALYTERCYKLCDEDYLEVARIEEKIEKLTKG